MNFHYIFPDKIIQPGNDPLPDVDYSESYDSLKLGSICLLLSKTLPIRQWGIFRKDVIA